MEFLGFVLFVDAEGVGSCVVGASLFIRLH